MSSSLPAEGDLRELVLAERELLVRHEESLNAKAAIIVGAAGVAGTLSLGLPTVYVITGIASSVLAGVFGVLALMVGHPRLAFHEAIRVLGRGGTAEEVDYGQIIEELSEARSVLAIRRVLIRAAALVLGLVAMLLLNGVIAREFPPSGCERDDSGRLPLRCMPSTYHRTSRDLRGVG